VREVEQDVGDRGAEDRDIDQQTAVAGDRSQASFFSIMFAYSRQLFALSRAGYLPRWLSLTGSRKTGLSEVDMACAPPTPGTRMSIRAPVHRRMSIATMMPRGRSR
jgi:hypothetical protein